MTDEIENNGSGEQLSNRGHSRRDVLRLGSFATLGAILGSGIMLGGATPAFAQKVGGTANQLASEPLNIVFAVYNGGTLLDFAGPSEVFHRLPNTNVRYASLNGGTVTLEFGVKYGNTERLADIRETDLIMVPGGSDMTEAMHPEFLAQIRRLAESAKYITSVCTGSLSLAAAGVLKGKRSACHWAFVNNLAKYGAIPVTDRFVEDDNGRFMSGGGVTSGIDFALRVAGKLKGKQSAEFAQLVIEYDPAPPSIPVIHEAHRQRCSQWLRKYCPAQPKGLRAFPA